MAIPTLYLFNLNTPKGAKLRRACLGIGVRTVPVSPGAHTLPLAAILQGEEGQGEAAFSEELLLMADFTGSKIDALVLAMRRAKIPPVGLMAVVTPTNRLWTALQLREELVREREAVSLGRRAEH